MNDDTVQAILLVIAMIPPGTVASYGQVAELAGMPRRARLVAQVLANAYASEELPWHRVIRADGRVAAHSSANEQIRRLRQENVELVDGRVNMQRFQWRDTI